MSVRSLADFEPASSPPWTWPGCGNHGRLGAATLWNALELVRRIVNFETKAGLSPALTFTIEMPKKDNEVVEYLEPEQAARLKAVLDEWPSRYAARMLEVAMSSGMRRGEVFKLRIRDLGFRAGLISIRDPKGGKTVSVPMNPITRAALEVQLAWKAEAFPDSPFVFPGKDGGQRVACSAASRIKQAACIPARFCIFHGLRHHFAVTLANSGEFTLDMIGELLTHKSTAMTRRYGQFLPDAKKRASDKAAELLTNHAGQGGGQRQEGGQYEERRVAHASRTEVRVRESIAHHR
jgi:integrase